MKVAISTDSGNVSAHFGRCPVFTLLEITNEKVVKQETIANPGHHPGLIPKFLSEQGVDMIISGGMGIKARGFFSEYDIKTYLGIQGSINQVVDDLIQGKLVSDDRLCQPGDGKGYGLDKTQCDHSSEDVCQHEGGVQ